MWLETYQQKVPGTSLPRWLPHPLTSPLFPDLTLLISFHHTDYNICHLSLSLPLSRCLSVTGTVVTYHRDAFTQNLLSTKPSISPLLLHVFQLHSDLHFFSPLIVVSSVYLLRLTFSISNSWLLLQFLAPVLLTPAIFFTSFFQFFFLVFFPPKNQHQITLYLYL